MTCLVIVFEDGVKASLLHQADLITLLDYPFQVVPVKVVKVLGKIRGEAALKALIGLLGASDGELQAVVAFTFENM